MTKRVANYLPRGINQFVPACSYAADVKLDGISVYSLGTPAVSDDGIIDTDVDADATAGTITTQDATADSPYGRTLIITPSGDPGAAGTLYVIGRDYLGQPMKESFTTTNGSTAVIYGKKAFKYIDSTVIGVAASNAITYKVGWGLRLGLPYKTAKLAWVKENGVEVDITPTQLLYADTTDPATISTGDPRGTFEGIATYDGSKEYVIGLMADSAVNSSGNGGLFGIKHYFA